jgi:tetratricopeptide (TPR) repeat protein
VLVLDKHYLELQFWKKIFHKNGLEFQSFFEDIMKSAFPDFETVKPYGNAGDRKNDGFRKKMGVYYQVYSPEDPETKQKNAAEKAKDDFVGLYDYWEDISPIREFHFVFNDKDLGVAPIVYETLSKMKKLYPLIEFAVLTTNNLRSIFFSLKEDQFLALGFSTDRRQVITNITTFLESIEIDLDRGTVEFASKALQKIKPSIDNIGDAGLQLEYGLLEARSHTLMENISEAKKKYQNLMKMFPKDVRPLLLLSEFSLNEEDYESNLELIRRADNIDKDNWFCKFEHLMRDLRLGVYIDVSDIDESLFPSEKRARSIFYRIYSIALANGKDYPKATEFIEKAIFNNSDRFANYEVRVSIREMQVHSAGSFSAEEYKEYEAEVNSLAEKWEQYGNLSLRNRISIDIRRLFALITNHKYSEVNSLAGPLLNNILKCYFDKVIDEILCGFLEHLMLLENDIDNLQVYLKKQKRDPSDRLSRLLILQFLYRNALFVRGTSFFGGLKIQRIVAFLTNCQQHNIPEVLNFLNQDVEFMARFINGCKEAPELRKSLIESIPEDNRIKKDRIWLRYYYETNQIDEAFKLLENLSISEISDIDCELFIKIAHAKQAWELESQFIEKLLKSNLPPQMETHLKLLLFTANYNLGRYDEVIASGKSLLENSEAIAQLGGGKNREAILGQIIIACHKRGEYGQALDLITHYRDFATSFEFIVSIEAETYLLNNDGQAALDTIIKGVSNIGKLTPEQYGGLYLTLAQIGNLLPQPLESLEQVVTNCFVKIHKLDQWYFVGNGCELDATKIPEGDERYPLFIGKGISSRIEFPFQKYSGSRNDNIIESIVTIEGYVHIQARDHFVRLSKEGRWKSGWVIETPIRGVDVDTTNIVAFLRDTQKSQDDFFRLYCENEIPFSFLVASQGSIVGAIGKIVQEDKGFVKFCAGTNPEINLQTQIAGRILNGEPVFIDGIAALFLSEAGMMEKVVKYLPKLMIPLSVINFLFEVSKKFRSLPGRTGYMGYAQGRLQFNEIRDQDVSRTFNNLMSGIKALESRRENVIPVSSARKLDVFTEQKIPPEICDACILAQKERAAILSEDFMYPHANALETHKAVPECCSSYFIVKALLEVGNISLEDYLNFFSFLAYYRCRFLPVCSNDLVSAVFGNDQITMLKPENLRKFNLRLILSEEYGVPLFSALGVISSFLGRVLVDDSITSDLSQRIFFETISPFLKNQNRRIIGKLLFDLCSRFVAQNQKLILSSFNVTNKLRMLERQIEIVSSDLTIM